MAKNSIIIINKTPLGMLLKEIKEDQSEASDRRI